jgi:hypothetical protein
MEADLRTQYVSFPPHTSDFFGSKFLPFSGTKLGQFFLMCFSSVMSTNFIIFGANFVTISTSQGVHHTVALPFTLKSILRQKNNYGNSNISPCKSIIFKKSS